jgi:hypothetical protein
MADNDVATCFKEYMAIYDGQDDKILADCRTIVDAILLPSLVVATPNGRIDYDQFIAYTPYS